MKKIVFLLPLVGIVALSFFACKPDDHDHEELITTVKLHFIKNGVTQTFSFKDLDGAGSGSGGVSDTIRIESDTMYQLNIEVLNESETPAEDITPEILAEATDHQFFYTITGANATHSYNDTDANGRPVGLRNTITTGALSTGTLRVNLKHQPGIKDGNQSSGESDIDVNFVLIIN